MSTRLCASEKVAVFEITGKSKKATTKELNKTVKRLRKGKFTVREGGLLNGRILGPYVSTYPAKFDGRFEIILYVSYAL